MKRIFTSLAAIAVASCGNIEDRRPGALSLYGTEVSSSRPSATTAPTAARARSASVKSIDLPPPTYTPVPSALQYYERPSAIKVLDEKKVEAEEVVVWETAAEPTFKTVKVAKGETLYSISRRHNAKVHEVAQANNLQPPFTLSTGQTLKIPEGTEETPKQATYFMPKFTTGTAFLEEPAKKDVVVAKGDTMFSIARAHNVPVKDLIEANPDVPPPYTLSIGQTLNLPAAAFYVVRKGDTLYSISRQFGLNLKSLAEINNIKEPFILSENQRIRLSAATIAPASAPKRTPTRNVIEVKNDRATVVAAPAPRATTPPRRPERPSDAKPDDRPAPTLAAQQTATPAAEPAFERPAPMTSDKFLWPVKGRVISNFGAKSGTNRNDGINIAAPLGTKVRAAENGVVVYAGNELKGLGNLVIIRHDKGFMSVYAHNDKLLVKKNQRVVRGEHIAEVGRTGRVSTPQLHFEIRERTRSIDPMTVLGKD
ncbi:MAG: LysM peptidoglycan-binding domain-containing protein [Alphaproteobacteria bacterium]|nr:LysM peptidoglycan-binding domain-containing protein [Alphaproteobacteria bacterium]